MDKKKVFLISNDIYLYSGIKLFLPDILLTDGQTLIPDHPLYRGEADVCFLFVDNRIPYCVVEHWLKRNGNQFFKVVVIALKMKQTRCINRGYERYPHVSGSLVVSDFMVTIERYLNVTNHQDRSQSTNILAAFELTDFEQEMLCAHLSNDRLVAFCDNHLVSIKSLYRYRERVTNRLGFSHINEAIIFLVRNNLLQSSATTAGMSQRGSLNDQMRKTECFMMALKNKEITPHFQPIIHVDGQLSGIEVFCHWPQGNGMTQQQIIAMAEGAGLMNELTNHLMAEVIRSFHREGHSWRDEIFISFNISPSCLKNPILYWDCLNFLEQIQTFPVKLMIEITESQISTITPAVKEMIRALRRKGVLFSLDYFGTGYANLCHLNKLDLDFIKIDKVFINNIKPGESSTPMLESIINMAGLLELETVAVGVEHDFQRQWLENNGINYLQGQHFSPATTFAQLNEFIYQRWAHIRPANDNDLVLAIADGE